MDDTLKRKWIVCLAKLYHRYTKELLDPSYIHMDKLCPLCSFATALSDKHPCCLSCIHLCKEFGQGKPCTQQKSFRRILYKTAPFTVDRKRAMAYRRAYIKRMRDKLIKSLK